MSDWEDEDFSNDLSSTSKNTSALELLSTRSEIKKEKYDHLTRIKNEPKNDDSAENDTKTKHQSDSNSNSSFKWDHLKKVIREKAISGKKQIELYRQNPSSPLYSIKSFEQLRIPDNLLKGLYAMGFQKPSHIQEQLLPLLMAKPFHNCIGQSQSGTGKTAAFLIASLRRVDATENFPQVLILSPTLELASQIGNVTREMAKFTEIKVRNIIKGEIIPRTPIIEHVLVGTPGKVNDWALRFKSFDLKKIKVFVLDEADIMISIQGHQQQSLKIQQELDPDCQLLLFSATYDAEVLKFAECIISNPIEIILPREEEVLDNVVQFYVHCSNDEEKYSALADIFGNVIIGQTIVFVHTKKSAVFLRDKLSNDGHKIALLTGELNAEERQVMIKRFRDGEERVLISTNLMSRGIDIEQVTLVVNYDLPYDVHRKDVYYEAYLHRIGRCGRFGKPGFAVSLIDVTKTQQLEQIKKLEQHFMKPITLLKASDSEEFKDWE